MCDGNLAIETHIYYSQFTTWRNSETKVMLFYATALLCTSSTNHILVQVQHFCQYTLNAQFELDLLWG